MPTTLPVPMPEGRLVAATPEAAPHTKAQRDRVLGEFQDFVRTVRADTGAGV
ncbi:hypothetical protein ACIPYQ_24140 [Streptomyces sp. NPDC090045]|uniref:hypothetical protein n=1 Tax=Streptomyces sp. NPDC090045 TaxID=3365927 RepID=UPI00380C8F8E